MENIIPKLINGEAKEENGKTEYYSENQKLDRFTLLACASCCENKQRAWEIMRAASHLYHCQNDIVFNELYGCIAEHLCHKRKENEFTIHSAFIKSVSDIFGGNAKVIHPKENQKHRPDVWIELLGEPVPVEIKKHAFNSKALAQLQRYVGFYECAKGIAVGNSLTVLLPDNITFINYNTFYGNKVK